LVAVDRVVADIRQVPLVLEARAVPALVVVAVETQAVQVVLLATAGLVETVL